MSEISKLAELRKMLLGMEQAFGLENLSTVERDLYYAANDLSDNQDNFRTMGLLEHTLVAGVSRPTVFRALKSLVQKGYLSPCGESGRGRYVVNAPSNKD